MKIIRRSADFLGAQNRKYMNSPNLRTADVAFLLRARVTNVACTAGREPIIEKGCRRMVIAGDDIGDRPNVATP